jgi:superoxide oxidase
VTITLHRLTLALIIEQFSAGWLHVVLGARSPEALLSSEAQFVIGLHRSLGTAIWVVTVGRLVWRLQFAKLPPFSPHMPKVEQQMAKAIEYGLYLLLVLQPLTGLAQTLFRGRPFLLFLSEVPAIARPDAAIANWFQPIHRAGAIGLLAPYRHSRTGEPVPSVLPQREYFATNATRGCRRC